MNSSHLDETHYFTPQEVAQRFRVSIMTINRLARQKKLQGIRCGKQWRFSEEAIKLFEKGSANGNQAYRG